jgi:hypothetical protein
MKITDFKKEDLEKGIMIRRKGWAKDISISFNKSASIFDAYINGIITGDKTDLTLEDITSDDWEIADEPNKSWKPKEGDTIFYITESGRVISGSFLSLLPSDNDKVLFNNAFQTREEAEHMLEKIKIINKLRELSNINFNETDDHHYMIVYHKTDNEIISDYCFSLNPIPFNVFFKTREDCQKAIETIGEDNLKKYYFDIKEEK